MLIFHVLLSGAGNAIRGEAGAQQTLALPQIWKGSQAEVET